ncbi:MAG: 6,7-dimethyl-8-ribityllumazine synthase [Bacteroidota bacterium]|nr:6,7-dimethyl-8-ribityllumazine synthase [Bacteroidota bacterium]
MSNQLQATLVQPEMNEELQKKKIGIVTADWNAEITNSLADSAKSYLIKFGILEENIITYSVPGSFELPLGVQYLIENVMADGVIAIGCLIKGETDHYHYIAQSCSQLLIQLQARYMKPIGFGLLTCDTVEQAQERAGGIHGNKGEEAANAVLRMLRMKEDLKKVTHKKTLGFGKS